MKKTKTITENITFSENQRFRQLWLRSTIMIPILVPLFVLIYRMSNSRPIPDLSVLVSAITFGIALFILFSIMELRTRVTQSAIYVMFFPFHTKWLRFPIEEVASFSSIKYNPIIEYGGWGIRFGVNGKVYNVSGILGVRLVFKNDKKLLIGSRVPDQFAAAIQNAMKRNPE